MDSTSAISRTGKSIARQAFIIGLVVFASYAYFYEGGGWNQNSRFDLTRAIVEHGTLRIDPYHENTGDKAFYDGHFYTDKAPGQPLLAVPAAAATRFALRSSGLNPGSARGVVVMAYIGTLFSVALPLALACACLFLVALRLGASTRAAAFGAIAMGLATPIWAYATLFWGHALAGSCLILGFAAAVMISPTDEAGDFWCAIGVGLGAGWATVTEYPAFPAAVLLSLFAVARVWPGGWHRRMLVAVGVVAGALPCIIVLMTYLHLAFGSYLRPSYTYEAGAFPWMSHGYFGLKYPRIDVAFKLLFGPRRGLFFFAPVAIVAPFGLRLLWKRSMTRLAAGTAAAVFVYYLLLNSSYADWTTGWSYGPRYMGAGIPALCVGLAPAWDRAGRNAKRVLLALLGISILFSLVAVSTTSQPPDKYRSPMTQLLWPSFWRGQLSLEHISMLGPAEEDNTGAHGAFNFGERLGLHGLPSLLPLLAVWALGAVAWFRVNARDGSRTEERALVETG